MKESLWLKRFDLLFQFAALMIPLTVAMLNNDTDYLMIAVLSCLGVQMFSCGVNFLFLKDRYVSAERPRFCFRLFAILLPAFLLGWLAFFVLWYFVVVVYIILFLCAFFMMLWYFTITIGELATIQRFIKRNQFN